MFFSVTVKSSVLASASFGIAIIFVLYILTRTYISDAGIEYINKRGVLNALPFLTQDRAVTPQKLKSTVIDKYPSFGIPLVRFNQAKKPKKAKEQSEPPEKVPPAIEKTVVTNGVEIKNDTPHQIDVKAVLASGVPSNGRGHRVLIVHTHGSESYTPTKENPYTNTGNYRTGDTNYNMIRIGDELTKALIDKGVEVIHDKTINDYPSYNDSYNKTAEVIQEYLKNYPDIGYVFDIHRDAVGDTSSPVKFVTEIHGQRVSQVMMVCGTDTNLSHPAWQDNLALAVYIQNYFDVNYTGFLRPINLREERFNMHLTKGSLIFEVGTNGNTLEESISSAQILGEGLGDIIQNLKNSG